MASRSGTTRTHRATTSGEARAYGASSIVRRYAPFVALVAVQVVIITVWPSVPSDRVAGGSTPGASATGPDVPGYVAASDASGPEVSHCVEGRQFDPGVDFYAPPCVPTWTGDNGGSTASGVDGEEIEVVAYYDQVNAFIASAGGDAVPSVSQRREFLDAAVSYLNDHVEMYGRKLNITVVEGSCTSLPPDIACYRNELRGIITDHHPYAVLYAGTCDACIDEILQAGVVAIGSQAFTDGFAQERAPYYWSIQQGASTVVRNVAEMWCTNFAGRPITFSTPGRGSLEGKPRRLGVLTANRPEYARAVNELAEQLATCGEEIAADYKYALDISTAAQQVQAGADRFMSANVTSIVSIADPIAPGFLYGQAQRSAWNIEAILSGTSLQDSDVVAQTTFLDQSGLSCPEGPPCVFDRAVGLATVDYVPSGDDAAAQVWKATGHDGLPTYSTAMSDWALVGLLSTLVQAAGPELTAENMDIGVRAYGVRGDDAHLSRGFPEGSYYWGQSSRAIYWDRDVASPVNGRTGSFVPVGGPLTLGEYPDDLFDEVPAR